MIHEIGVELQAALRAKGCPFSVVDVDAPNGTHAKTAWVDVISIEHDEGGDRFGPVISQHVNPKHRRTRSIGAKLTIYAKSRKAGAMPFEHRRRAEQVLDLVLVAMDRVAADRKNRWAPTGGRFITPEDLDGSERKSGAVYELTFTFDRAVMDRTWEGDAQPEATLVGGRSITKVSLAHGHDDDNDPNTPPASAETACGA